MKTSRAPQRLVAVEASMTIEERRAAAKAQVKVLGDALRQVTGQEATQVVAEALCEAIREVCLIDIEVIRATYSDHREPAHDYALKTMVTS